MPLVLGRSSFGPCVRTLGAHKGTLHYEGVSCAELVACVYIHVRAGDVWSWDLPQVLYRLHEQCTLSSAGVWPFGARRLSRATRVGRSWPGAGMLGAQAADVAVQRVMRDLPQSADLDGFDLAGGEEAEHEGPANAEEISGFLHGVQELSGPSARCPGSPALMVPGLRWLRAGWRRPPRRGQPGPPARSRRPVAPG